MPVTGKTTVLNHQPSVNIIVLGVLRSRNAELSVTGWETSRPTGGCALPSCRFPYSFSTLISSLTWLTRGFPVLILQLLRPSTFLLLWALLQPTPAQTFWPTQNVSPTSSQSFQTLCHQMDSQLLNLLMDLVINFLHSLVLQCLLNLVASKTEFAAMEEAGIVRMSNSPWSSPYTWRRKMEAVGLAETIGGWTPLLSWIGILY